MGLGLGKIGGSAGLHGYWNKYRGEKHHGPQDHENRTKSGLIILLVIGLLIGYWVYSTVADREPRSVKTEMQLTK